ncbi:NAD(P)-dependent oxidoreductase [Schleiferiaceae bacterium]|nr:NAD(P)-dependent oxidoreductase [Schleiferiaceae bacterium]
MKKKIFVTGGTGFFGKSLLRHLQLNNLYEEYEIYIFSRNPDKFVKNCHKSIDLTQVKFIQGDVLNPDSLPHNKFDYVIHAATDSTFGPELGLVHRSSQIVDGTSNILKWCEQSQVLKFLYISSGGVYGNSNVKVDENHLSAPDTLEINSTYSISKRFSEHLCALYLKEYGIPFAIARCFSFVGIDLPRDAHFAIGNFLQNAMQNEDIIINGDGSPIRSYMNQYDLADWLMQILISKKATGVFNVGSSEEISLIQLAELIHKMTGCKGEIVVQNGLNPAHSNGRNIYVPDIRKAKDVLGLKCSKNLRESLRDIIQELL